VKNCLPFPLTLLFPRPFFEKEEKAEGAGYTRLHVTWLCFPSGHRLNKSLQLQERRVISKISQCSHSYTIAQLDNHLIL